MNAKEMIVKEFVSRGQLREASEAAKLAKRKLTKSEVLEIIRINEEKGFMDRALEAAEYGKVVEKIPALADLVISQKERNHPLDTVLEIARKYGRWDECRRIEKKIALRHLEETARRYGVSGMDQDLDEVAWANIALQHLTKGNETGAFFLVHEKDRTGKIYKAVVDQCINSDSEHNKLIDKVVGFISGREYKFSSFSRFKTDIQAINRLVKECLNQGKLNNALFLIGCQGVSPENNEAIMEALVKSEEMYSCAACAAEEIGRTLRQDEIDSIVIMLAQRYLKDAVKAAEELGASNRAYDKLVGCYINIGKLDGAVEMAKRAGRTLTREETAEIIKFCVTHETRGYPWYSNRAIDAAKIGTTQEAVDLAVRHTIKVGDLHQSKLARELHASREVVLELLEHAITGGYLDEAMGALKILGRDMTSSESDRFIDNILRGKNGMGSYTLGKALEAARFGAGRDRIEKIVKAAVKDGEFECAKKAATMLGRRVTPDEARKIMDVCIQRGKVKEAAEAARLLNSK